MPSPARISAEATCSVPVSASLRRMRDLFLARIADRQSLPGTPKYAAASAAWVCRWSELETIACGAGSPAIAQISSRASQTSQPRNRAGGPSWSAGALAVPGLRARAAGAGKLARARPGPLMLLGLVGEQHDLKSEPGGRGKKAQNDRIGRFGCDQAEPH